MAGSRWGWSPKVLFWDRHLNAATRGEDEAGREGKPKQFFRSVATERFEIAD